MVLSFGLDSSSPVLGIDEPCRATFHPNDTPPRFCISFSDLTFLRVVCILGPVLKALDVPAPLSLGITA